MSGVLTQPSRVKKVRSSIVVGFVGPTTVVNVNASRAISLIIGHLTIQHANGDAADGAERDVFRQSVPRFRSHVSSWASDAQQRLEALHVVANHFSPSISM